MKNRSQNPQGRGSTPIAAVSVRVIMAVSMGVMEVSMGLWKECKVGNVGKCKGEGGRGGGL